MPLNGSTEHRQSGRRGALLPPTRHDCKVAERVADTGRRLMVQAVGIW